MRRIHALWSVAVIGIIVGCQDGATAGPTGVEASFDRAPRADEVAGDALFRFERLAGNPRPFIGSANPIRGINAGGLPWVLDRGEARLDADGELRVEVRGLVLDPNDATVISRGLAGNNVSPQFKAILSCLSVDGVGAAVTVNVATAPVDTETGVGGGDATIRERVAVPDPCIAPIVFVTSAGGAWFAASGF